MSYRYYSDVAPTVKLFASMDASTNQMVLTASLATQLPSFPFILRIEPDSVNEELVLVSSGAGVVGNPYIVTRGYSSTTAKSHAANSDVEHGVGSVDFKDSRDHEALGKPGTLGALGPHGLPYTAWGAPDINVKDFGAKGDGVTDDTAAIQAAIAATTWPLKAGAVTFPQGRYLISSEILLDAGVLTSSPELVLRGVGAEIYNLTPSINMFRLTDTMPNGLTFVRFQNLVFFNNAVGAVSILLNNTEGVAVEGCRFVGGGHTAIKMNGQNNFTRIQDSFFNNMARGIHMNGDSSWTTITNCQFTEGLTGGSPLNWIEGAVASNFVKISNCIFYGQGATVPIIRITAGIQWTIENCNFNECDQEGIYFGFGGTSDSHIVRSCQFYHMKKDYIKSAGANMCSVIGCVFGNYLLGTANTFSNVKCLDTFGNNQGSGWVISGNISTESAANIDQVVSCDASCQKMIITGNRGAAGFTAAGTGCVLDNNVT